MLREIKKMMCLFFCMVIVLSVAAGCKGKIKRPSSSSSESSFSSYDSSLTSSQNNSGTSSTESSSKSSSTVSSKTPNNVPPTAVKVNPTFPKLDYIECFSDLNFVNGFIFSSIGTSAATPYKNADVTNLYGLTKKPLWKIPQWFSKDGLQGKAVAINGDTATITSQDKSLTVTKRQGQQSSISLELKAEQYYGNVPRKEGDPWPHLGIEQNLLDRARVCELDALKLSVKPKIDYLTLVNDTGKVSGLHEAIFGISFTIQNMNRSSNGYGNEYFWFQIPIYNTLNPNGSEEWLSVDGGKSDATGKWMYGLATNLYAPTPITIGTEANINYDILPKIKEVFNKIKNEKKGFVNSNWEDMYVTMGSSGWEIGGIYNAKATLKDLSLKAYYKDKRYKTDNVPFSTNFANMDGFITSDGVWSVSNNTLSEKTALSWSSMATIKNSLYNNFIMDFKMSLNSRTDGWAGVTFRKSSYDLDSMGSGYSVMIRKDGSVYLAYNTAFVDGSGMKNIGTGKIDNFQLNQFYSYRVVTKGNNIKLYVNGDYSKAIIDANDSFYEGPGYISFINGQIKVSFKDVSVVPQP